VDAAPDFAADVDIKDFREDMQAKCFCFFIRDSKPLKDVYKFIAYDTWEHSNIPMTKLNSEAKTYLMPNFICDRALAICGKTGIALVNFFRVSDTSEGEESLGIKHKAASTIAQHGFCTNCSQTSFLTKRKAMRNFKTCPCTLRHCGSASPQHLILTTDSSIVSLEVALCNGLLHKTKCFWKSMRTNAVSTHIWQSR